MTFDRTNTIDDIFYTGTTVVIQDPIGASAIRVVSSPNHGMLTLCQDDNADYDVIVMSQKQARELAKALNEWVWSLGSGGTSNE